MVKNLQSLEPEYHLINTIHLVGLKTVMSIVDNKTFDLWKKFIPIQKKLNRTINSDLYSVEVYDSPEFFREFNPSAPFEKWAAVEVENFFHIPAPLKPLLIPEGLYAVFHYRGKPSEVKDTLQYIYGEWIPSSGFHIDDRPHFALMGEKYLGEDPNSEETFWIPIRKNQNKGDKGLSPWLDMFIPKSI